MVAVVGREFVVLYIVLSEIDFGFCGVVCVLVFQLQLCSLKIFKHKHEGEVLDSGFWTGFYITHEWNTNSSPDDPRRTKGHIIMSEAVRRPSSEDFRLSAGD